MQTSDESQKSMLRVIGLGMDGVQGAEHHRDLVKRKDIDVHCGLLCTHEKQRSCQLHADHLRGCGALLASAPVQLVRRDADACRQAIRLSAISAWLPASARPCH